MIEAYQQQLLRYYKGYLKDVISGKPFSVIVLRGEKNKPTTTIDLHKAISLFQKNEKSTERKGWKIEWEDWRSKKLGKQKWASKIIVETEEDYLHLLKKEEEIFEFKQQLQNLLQWQPAIQSFLLDKPERILHYKDIWSDIQKVADYLLQYDVSNQYIRTIPVHVHTKFLEKYGALLSGLLKAIHPEKFVLETNDLSQLLSLKQKPHIYPLRWLDKELSAQYMHGMEVTGVTIDWLRKLNWQIKEVWLVENETNLYLIPERKNAIAIFSKGYATLNLQSIPVLQNATLYYWGDLDEDGYKMLNAMRGYYSTIISVFMNETTLLQHAGELGKQDATYKTTLLPHLSKEELAAFTILKHHNGRLEQERIRQDYILHTLALL